MNTPEYDPEHRDNHPEYDYPIYTFEIYNKGQSARILKETPGNEIIEVAGDYPTVQEGAMIWEAFQESFQHNQH